MRARPGRTQFGFRLFAQAWGFEPGGWVGRRGGGGGEGKKVKSGVQKDKRKSNGKIRREQPFVDPGTTPGTFRARGAKSCEKVRIWLNFGGSRGPQFEPILVKLMTFQRLVFCCFFG